MILGDIGRTSVCAEICKGLDICVWNEFISASFSEPKLLGWHSATTASVLEVLSFLLQKHCCFCNIVSCLKVCRWRNIAAASRLPFLSNAMLLLHMSRHAAVHLATHLSRYLCAETSLNYAWLFSVDHKPLISRTWQVHKLLRSSMGLEWILLLELMTNCCCWKTVALLLCCPVLGRKYTTSLCCPLPWDVCVACMQQGLLFVAKRKCGTLTFWVLFSASGLIYIFLFSV